MHTAQSCVLIVFGYLKYDFMADLTSAHILQVQILLSFLQEIPVPRFAKLKQVQMKSNFQAGSGTHETEVSRKQLL